MNLGTGNSDSDIIDEEHYHPPRDSAGSVSSFPLYNDDDEFFDAQDGGMGGSPKPNSRRVTPNQSRGGSGYNSEGTGHTHKRQGSGSSGKSEGEGGNYINLKNLSGLTSPPLKNESLQDDISSLSSYSLEGTNIIASRNNSTDKGQPPPLPPRPTVYGEKKLSPTSSAMKLFKNIDYGQSGEDDEDHEDEEDEVRPISRAPEKYDFNLQSFRNSAINKGSAQLMLSPVKEGKREGGISDLNEEDEDDESHDENKVQSDLPPSLRSPLNDSPPLPPSSRPTSSKRLFLHQRHNSLKRRSVNINEEVLLTSALFGLNEFKPTNTPHSSGAASAAASTLETTIGLKSATSELFRDKLRLAQSLQGHEGPIWCMKFSPNGQYLATGGQDTRVLIWCVVSLPKSTKLFSSTDSSDSPTPGGSHDDLEELGNNKTNNNNDDNNQNNSNNRNSFGKKRTSTTNNQSNATTSLSGELEGLINPFLNTEPYRIYEGHTHDITDLSWSKSNFLLSSSMDKTVRLWHVSKNDCLQYFRHPDIVTCVEFHPLHDRYFVSGCFDRRLRVWDIIPTGNVREWVSANDTITAVSFSPDGLTVAGGLIQGQIFFYEYEGMKYITQMDCRNRNGKYKKGCKVSGMTYYQRKDMVVSNADGSSPVNTPDTVNNQHSSNNNNNNSSSTNSMKIETKANTKSHVNFPTSSSFFKKKGANVSTNQLLVTTNDSRIRLCLLEDYSTFCKYKGLKNRSMQIKSSFSDDCEYIICGSEYGQVFIWKTFDEQIHSKIFKFNFLKQKDILRNKLYENFDANDDHCAVISALFAPIESVRRYVKSHKDLLLQLLQNQQIAQTWMQQHPHLSTGSNGSHATDGDSSNTSTKAMNEINQMSLATRVICTADFNGLIRVFYRIN